MQELVIDRNEIEIVKQAGINAYPREACGIIAGIKDEWAWHAECVYPMKNECAPDIFDRFIFGADERLQVEKKIAAGGMQVVGFFHSHPDHEAYFSHTDLINTEEYQFGQPWLPPSYAYLVISVKRKVPANLAAFKVEEGKSVAITIKHEIIHRHKKGGLYHECSV
ncbi:MAG: M67 family metallopeptidase [Oligoflexales bacterium]|nr:M67 family metallopeptidase [Oligoflexales bacterium]